MTTTKISKLISMMVFILSLILLGGISNGTGSLVGAKPVSALSSQTLQPMVVLVGDSITLFSEPYIQGVMGNYLDKPIVGTVATAGTVATNSNDGSGYWLVASNGIVGNYGSAPYESSVTTALASPIVGMAATPDGNGYWLVASDGGIFSYGDAKFYGSEGNKHLNKPIVGMAATHDGKGYWLVASDGGIFSFGDAKFYGSTGSMRLTKPIVGIAATPDGKGYWLVASDGGIFSYGDAKFHGSTSNVTLKVPIDLVVFAHLGYRIDQEDGNLVNALRWHPQEVIVNLGTNDSLQHYANALTNLQIMINQIHSAGVRCVAFYTISQTAGLTGNKTAAAIDKQILQLPSKYGWSVINWANFLATTKPNPYKYLVLDGIHPNNSGRQWIANSDEAFTQTCLSR